MVKLSEMELKTLIQGGETNTVELKVAAPRATEMAERLYSSVFLPVSRSVHGADLSRVFLSPYSCGESRKNTLLCKLKDMENIRQNLVSE